MAWVLWLLAGALTMAAWLIWDDHIARHLGRTALLLSVAAGTATVRLYIVQQNQVIRAAFKLGREGHEAVRTIR